MRNVWKGFVVGALTGAGVGLARDWDRRRRADSGDLSEQSTSASSLVDRMTSDDVWKGFVLGAVTGAGIGIVADLGEMAAQAASQTAQAVREHGPELAHRVAESDTTKALTDTATTTAQRAAEAARQAGSTVGEFAEDAVQTAQQKLPNR